MPKLHYHFPYVLPKEHHLPLARPISREDAVEVHALRHSPAPIILAIPQQIIARRALV